MDQVKINRNQLLEAVRANAQAHRALFEKAQVGYRKAVVAELDRMLQLARDGGQIEVMVQLAAPVDQTDQYERVVRMLEMSVDDEVKLSAHDFERYVMDKWEWSAHAFATNTTYATA